MKVRTRIGADVKSDVGDEAQIKESTQSVAILFPRKSDYDSYRIIESSDQKSVAKSFTKQLEISWQRKSMQKNRQDIATIQVF